MRAAILVPIASLFFHAAPAFCQSAEEVARRFVTMAYEGRSADLPKSGSAATQSFERKIRNALRVRCIRPVVEVTHVASGSELATVSLEATLLKEDRIAPETPIAPERTSLRLKLAHENGTWVVTAVEFPDDEFAQQLLAASDEEREGLLRRAKPERISPGLARALYARALGILNTGKFDTAARAGAIAREIAIAAGDRGGEALALGIAMFVAVMARDEATAMRLSSESLALTESVGDPDVLARAWYNRGRALPHHGMPTWHSGIESERLDFYRRALSFAERAEDPTLLISVLYSMANLARASTDHLTARRYIDRILPIAREVGDAAGEMSCESVLASIYFMQGDHERGFFHHSRALNLAETNRLYAYPSLLLQAGWALAEEKRFDEARAAFAKVFARDAHGVLLVKGSVPHGHVGDGLLSLAEVEAEQGRLDEAECLVREAATYQRLPESRFLYVVARHYLERRRYAVALRLALASLTEGAFEGYDDYKIKALETVARTYRGLGDHEHALATILETIELRESMNSGIAGDERQRAHASNRTAGYYELAAEIALDGGDPSEALAFLERGRALVLTDILENGRPRAIADADAADEQERIRREKTLAGLNIEVDRARAAGTPADADLARERLRQERAAYSTFLDGIRARSERRLAGRLHMDGRRLSDAIKRLPARTVAVEYLVTDRHLHVFVASGSAGTALRHRVISVERAVVAEKVNRFADALAKRRVGVRTPARDLYELLIEPIESEISGAETLLVIPDEGLWRVPFAALVDARGRFLLERSAIVYAPSITVYTLMAGARGEPLRPRPSSLLAVGNPTLDSSATTAFTSFYRDATLNPLPDAEREVDVLQGIYRHAVVLKGAEATEAKAKAAVGEAGVVHFATHALFDDHNPMYSRLALARDRSAADDGWLEAWEIMRLDVPADLVVLSACETARGKIGGGEGVVGMAWSFFIAGARSTLAAQWKVSSAGSADLMIAFHRSLRAREPGSPMRKAAALRDAQLRLLRDGRYRHPFYWAAFVILGDGS